MTARINSIGAASTACLAAVLTALGCGGGQRAQSGRAILAELERDRIPLPDEYGRSSPGGVDQAGVAQPGNGSGDRLPASGPVQLADLLRVAEDVNPDLAAARSRVGIAAGAAWQAALYPNPSVEASIEEWPT